MSSALRQDDSELRLFIRNLRDPDISKKKDTLDNILSCKQQKPSLRTFRLAEETVRRCILVLTMSKEDPTYSMSKDFIMARMDRISMYLSQDEKNKDLLDDIQVIWAIGTMLGYGDYFAEICKSFRSSLNNQNNPELHWKNTRITKIWDNLIAEEAEFADWEKKGCVGKQPGTPRKAELVLIAEQTGLAFKTVRDIIECYSCRNSYAHCSNISEMIDNRNWTGLATRIVKDREFLNHAGLTHPLFVDKKDAIEAVLQQVETKYFKSIDVFQDPKTGEYGVSVPVLQPGIQAEHNKKQEAFKKLKEEEKKMKAKQQQALTVFEAAIEAGTLDEATSADWNALKEKREKRDLETKKFQEEKRKIEAEIKKCKQHLVEYEKQKAKLALDYFLSSEADHSLQLKEPSNTDSAPLQ